jgi:signal transduction histidine kinase
MPTISFSVDSALLRELGERLVGKPHIALAELIKNSYDADATRVIVRFVDGEIEVADNGHGMNFQEFKKFWMRIGTPHKQAEGFSRYLKRPVTGSKGVGRLAVQFLGKHLRICTVSRKNPRSELNASVDWDKAVKAGELTRAQAQYSKSIRKTTFPGDRPYGTTIVITDLNQLWQKDDFIYLAREIWPLQPPFRANPELTNEQQKDFLVELESPERNIVQEFNQQMSAILDIWEARLAGKLSRNVREGNRSGNGTCKVQLSLEFADQEKVLYEYPVPDCALHSAEFEIRVFHLEHRQPRGIRVEKAREYMNSFGGIHAYDAGFHLPYYGAANDWLHVEFDHAHRLSKSHLLPKEFHVPDGMNFLPTQSRLFGVVHVNTSRERELSGGEGEYLKIQVTRDRLVENQAYENLVKIVRTALDFYAMQAAKRAHVEFQAIRDVEPLKEKVVRVEHVLERHRDAIPRDVYESLQSEITGAIEAVEAEGESLTNRAGLLGALATAGISALAYEHEFKKQFTLLEDILQQLGSVRSLDSAVNKRLKDLTGSLSEWLEKERGTRALFSHLLQEENRERRERTKARATVEEVRTQIQVLMRGIEIRTTGIDETLRLPRATFAEWSAIFQNVFLNAANAMVDAQKKLIVVSSRVHGRNREILVQDTGVGVNLEEAEDLFKPFVRKLEISSQRRALGYGGSGLGLTIVRMIADQIHCHVKFIEPESGFSTGFQLGWREEE